MSFIEKLLDGAVVEIPFFVFGLILAAVLAFLVAFLMIFRILRAKTISEFRARFQIEQFYGMMFAAPDGYFTWFYNYDGKEPQSVCSHKLAVMFDLKRGTEASFDDLLVRMGEKGKKQFMLATERLKTLGENFSIEVQVLGSSQRIIAIGKRVQNAKGIVLADTIWFRDITRQSDFMDELYSENKYIEGKYSFVQKVMDALPFPLWSRDDNLNINYCNKAYAEAVGMVAPDEVVAKSVELASGDGLLRLQAMAKDAKAKKQKITVKEYMVMGAKRHFVELTEQFLEGCDGEFKRSTIGMAIPIDNEAELSGKVKAYSGAHDGVLANLTTAIGIFDADTRLSFYNQQFLLLWGLDSDWLDKKPTYSSFLEELRKKRMLPEMRNFSAFKAEEIEMCKTLLRPKDNIWYLPNQKIIRRFMMAHPLGGVLFSYEDVTDSVALESSYRTLIEVQKATIDNIHEAVLLLDDKGHLKLCNSYYASLWNFDEAFLKTSPSLAELVEHHKPFFTDKDSEWPDFKAELVRFLAGDTGTQLTLNREDGRILDVSAIKLADGGTLISFEDVTSEVKRDLLHEKASEVMSRKNAVWLQFMTDLGNILTKRLDELYEVAKKVSGAQLLAEKAKDAKDIYEDLMALVLAEMPLVQQEHHKVDVAELLEDVVKDLRKRAARKAVELDFDYNGKTKSVISSNAKQLGVLFFYVIAQMIRLLSGGGKIAITLKTAVENGTDVVNVHFDPYIAIKADDDPYITFFGEGSALVAMLVTGCGGKLQAVNRGKFVSLLMDFPAV